MTTGKHKKDDFNVVLTIPQLKELNDSTYTIDPLYATCMVVFPMAAILVGVEPIFVAPIWGLFLITLLVSWAKASKRDKKNKVITDAATKEIAQSLLQQGYVVEDKMIRLTKESSDFIVVQPDGLKQFWDAVRIDTDQVGLKSRYSVSS